MSSIIHNLSCFERQRNILNVFSCALLFLFFWSVRMYLTRKPTNISVYRRERGKPNHMQSERASSGLPSPITCVTRFRITRRALKTKMPLHHYTKYALKARAALLFARLSASIVGCYAVTALCFYIFASVDFNCWNIELRIFQQTKTSSVGLKIPRQRV